MTNPIHTIPEKDSTERMFSKAVKAGRRTYFFDVKTTCNNDHYIVITESRKIHDAGNGNSYEKHKIFLYKEDFEKFLSGFQDSVEFIRINNLGSLQEYDNTPLTLDPMLELEKELELL